MNETGWALQGTEDRLGYQADGADAGQPLAEGGPGQNGPDTPPGQVEEAVSNLIKAIHNSSEYRRYQNTRAKVHTLPELEHKIHAFRKKNYETQNVVEEWNLYERVDELEREGIEIRKDPLVDEYLSAELGFCRLYQNINWTIVQNIDFDLGFTLDK